MEKKALNELIKDERDREIDLKAGRNARIAEKYVIAMIVIVSLICNQSFVGWIVLSVNCFTEIVASVTKYHYYQEKTHLRAAVLYGVLLLSASFLAVSGILER